MAITKEELRESLKSLTRESLNDSTQDGKASIKVVFPGLTEPLPMYEVTIKTHSFWGSLVFAFKPTLNRFQTISYSEVVTRIESFIEFLVSYMQEYKQTYIDFYEKVLHTEVKGEPYLIYTPGTKT